MGFGGKGSNQAIAAAKYGADTRFVARVGADDDGRDRLALYQRTGVSTDWIPIDDSRHSGVAMILVDEDGLNMISVAYGANFALSAQDIDRAMPAIRESFITGFQLENKLETVFYGIHKVHESGGRTFLDPAPAAHIPDEIYPRIDIIKPNETEARFLTGIEVRDAESAKAAGVWFIKKGVRTAIITLGNKGVALISTGLTRYFPAPSVHAVDSTGAGDIFSGAFLYSLASGKSTEDAIQFAIVAASLSTELPGVVGAIPEVAVVMRKMQGFQDFQEISYG